jgi:metallo-beta-lactamase family protein
MPIKLTFLGAAENVTGSRYLLDVNGRRLLIDCGLFQEHDLKARNWEPFPVPPSSIDAVLLTHAHLDHCGYLPKLVRDGFKGRVYGTLATAEIAKVVLLDSAKIQAEDAEFKRKRHEREHRRGAFLETALYSVDDVESCCSLYSAVPYNTPTSLAEDIEFTLVDAGHILGSASIHLKAGGKTIVFSGDIGRWDRPILENPDFCPPADYIVMESTYGDRVHDDTNLIADNLAGIVNDTRRRGGNLVIPTFAIGRAQEVLYYFNELLRENRIPHLMVFLDSPMAVTVTSLFEKHLNLMDDDLRQLIQKQQSPFHFPGLHMVRTVDESKAINHISGTVAVMAGAGMCTGGRIKHHLVNNISRPDSTILFVGYQAAQTLGRLILDGVTPIRILGQAHPVRARIEQVPGFSGHADRNELMQWLSKAGPVPPRHVFVTHGEPETARLFAAAVHERKGCDTSVPRYGETALLD